MEENLKKIYEETQNLKDSIELIELLNDPNKSNSGSGLLLENLIQKFVNVKVKMYKEHHNQPHIHLDIGRQNHIVSISIENQEILARTVERKYEKTVKDWIEKNKQNLLIIWNQIQDGQTFDLSILN